MSEGVKLILTEIRSLKAAVEARLDAVDKQLEAHLALLDGRLTQGSKQDVYKRQR